MSPGVRDAAVGDHRHTVLAGLLRGEVDRRQLRHPRTADHTRGADRPGADTDLDRVGSGCRERVDTLLGDDVAGHDRKRRPRRLDPFDRLDHPGGVAVGGVDGHRIDGLGEQGLDALLEIGADADRRGAPQAARRVAGRVGELLTLEDVLDRDEPDQSIVGIDERQLLDAVLLKDGLGLFQRGAFAGGDETCRRHELGDRAVEVGARAEPGVAVGEDADESAVRVGDRHAAELEAVHQRLGVVQRRAR
jgi:hypothetical protein